ncbi:hypothetical protein K6Y78_40120, partial [Burkholderia cenocepacia]|uniref:hypothetical protein n=1 Tax=Burkholderia cenocepacia TaxID=95486 RepID=UPI002230E249
ASMPSFNAASVPRAAGSANNLDNSGKALTRSSISRSTIAVNQNGNRAPAIAPNARSGEPRHHLSNPASRI